MKKKKWQCVDGVNIHKIITNQFKNLYSSKLENPEKWIDSQMHMHYQNWTHKI